MLCHTGIIANDGALAGDYLNITRWAVGLDSPSASPQLRGGKPACPGRLPCELPLAVRTTPPSGCRVLEPVGLPIKIPQTSWGIFIGGPSGTRTHNTLLKRQVL